MAAPFMLAFKAFSALLRMYKRRADNNASSENLKQSLQTVVNALGTSQRALPDSIQSTVASAQEKLITFVRAGWLSRLGDWESRFNAERDSLLLSLITHVAADVISRQENAGQPRLPVDTSEPRVRGIEVTGPETGWRSILVEPAVRPDIGEAQSFVRVAGQIVEDALKRGPGEWNKRIRLEDLPDFLDSGEGCAEDFVEVLMVEGVDRATCQRLAQAVEQVRCPMLLKGIVQVLTRHLGTSGKQAASRTLKCLLEGSRGDEFVQLMCEALNGNVLKSLGELLTGDEVWESIAILRRLTQADGSTRKTLLCLRSDPAAPNNSAAPNNPAAPVLFGAFCTMKMYDATWQEAEVIVKRLGKVARSKTRKDAELREARKQIVKMLGRKNGLGMVVLVRTIFNGS